MDAELSEAEIRRYARHIVLRELGGDAQLRLKRASVLVVGAGGLGAPLLLYLAAAGVGRLGIVDDDDVTTSNLQRQVVFTTSDAGSAKAEAAAGRLRDLNPLIELVPVRTRLVAGNVAALLETFDLVADGSDNLATRTLVQDACHRLRKPLVSAAVQALDGQLATYKPYLGPPHPCARCMHRGAVDESVLPSCAQGGVLGPAAGVMGSLQAVEVIKELVGFGDDRPGRLLLYDAARATMDHVRVRRLAECAPGCRHLPAVPGPGPIAIGG